MCLQHSANLIPPCFVCSKVLKCYLELPNKPRVHLIVYSNTYIFLKKSEDHLKAENSVRAQGVIVYEGVFVLNL